MRNRNTVCGPISDEWSSGETQRKCELPEQPDLALQLDAAVLVLDLVLPLSPSMGVPLLAGSWASSGSLGGLITVEQSSDLPSECFLCLVGKRALELGFVGDADEG